MQENADWAKFDEEVKSCFMSYIEKIAGSMRICSSEGAHTTMK